MDAKEQRRIAFAIFGVIFAGSAGSIWGAMLTMQPLGIGYDRAGFAVGVLVALSLLAIGEALRKS
jgi:hypothetical protein